MRKMNKFGRYGVFPWVVALLAVTRLIPHWMPLLGSDIPGFAGYAVEFESAHRLGMSFFAFRALPATAKAAAEGPASSDIGVHDGQVFEYPPLALVPIVAPRLALSAIGGGAPARPVSLRQYQVAFRLQMAAVDLALFVLLTCLLRRIYPHESWQATSGRLLVYVAGGALFSYVMYDRLDLPLAALLTISLGVLVTSSKRNLAFLILAAAVAYKLAPLFLIPLWAVGGLRFFRRERQSGARFGLEIAARAGINAAMILGLSAACFLPAYITGGKKSLSFLDYHQDRGIEVESTYATVCLTAYLLGDPVAVSNSYGSTNVVSAWTPRLAKLATIAMIGGILLLSAAYGTMAIPWRRAVPTSARSSPITVGQASAGLTISMVAACLLTLLLTAKVLSPQYILWLVPVICLMPGTPRQRRTIFVVFLIVCLLTLVVFPILFWALMEAGTGGHPGILTVVAIAALAARNAGLLSLLLQVLWVARQPSLRA